MKVDELLARMRQLDPDGMAQWTTPAELRLVRTTLRALGLSIAERTDQPLVVSGLGTFRHRKPEPGTAGADRPKVLYTPALAAAQPWAAVDTAAWFQALKSTERPLIDPQGRFIVLFSAKAACSSVVIWFLHQIGLAAEARAVSDWPHHYRIDHYYQRPDYLAARQAVQPGAVTVLRVVRDPVERAASSFRHALGLSYARDSIRTKLGIDTDLDGLSFERYIDFLELEDLNYCDPHHRRQKHVLESLRAPDVVINASRQDLFVELNAFERRLGLTHTDFPALAWIHELQAGRVPHNVATPGDAYRLVLTREQAQRGPWPQGLITADARRRLERLYAEDVALYA